jgi:hypothetical protein
VQSYNSKIRHKESVEDIKIPPGVTIKSKARRNQGDNMNDPLENDEEPVSDETPRKKQKQNGKKIRFSVAQNVEESE